MFSPSLSTETLPIDTVIGAKYALAALDRSGLAARLHDPRLGRSRGFLFHPDGRPKHSRPVIDPELLQPISKYIVEASQLVIAHFSAAIGEQGLEPLEKSAKKPSVGMWGSYGDGNWIDMSQPRFRFDTAPDELYVTACIGLTAEPEATGTYHVVETVEGITLDQQPYDVINTIDASVIAKSLMSDDTRALTYGTNHNLCRPPVSPDALRLMIEYGHYVA
ncbi:MAG: hypothetical protein AAF413_04355 [Patescibacteria group bacterium]